MAVDCAARTSPSISAPVKFFVWTAKSARSTSAASNLCSRIFAVWISRICTRPCSSGRPEEEPTHAETTFWGDYCRHLSRNSKHFHSVKEHLWDTHSFFFKLRLSARPWKTMSILRQIWFFSTKFLTWSHPESTRLASLNLKMSYLRLNFFFQFTPWEGGWIPSFSKIWLLLLTSFPLLSRFRFTKFIVAREQSVEGRGHVWRSLVVHAWAVECQTET